MDGLSHMHFVILSYGLTALVVGALFLWLVVTGRTRSARIEALSGSVPGATGERTDD